MNQDEPKKPYSREMSDNHKEMLREMPSIRSTISKSRDGKLLIHRTTITHIKPVAYYEAVLAGKNFDEEVDA